MTRNNKLKNNNVGFVPTNMINNQGEPMGLQKDGEFYLVSIRRYKKEPARYVTRCVAINGAFKHYAFGEYGEEFEVEISNPDTEIVAHLQRFQEIY